MNEFIEYKFLKHRNTIIFLFDVKKDIPTTLEWVFAIEEFKEKMEQVKEKQIEFAYVLDIRLVGLLSISQIKEFVYLLQSMSELLEAKLICSSVIAEGSIIKTIFELVKMFYNTKKPLKIVNTMEEATIFIDENTK